MDRKENSNAGGEPAPDAADDARASKEPPGSSAPQPPQRWLSYLNERYRTLDPRWLGVFRICFGCLLLSELVTRWQYARLFFSNDGLLPNHFSLFAPMAQDLFSIYHVFSTTKEVHVAFALTFVVFACFTLGYHTRVFHVLSAILITSLHGRNLFIENGGSVVTHSLAIWTVFLPLGRCFSLDSLRRSFARVQEHSAGDLNRREPFGAPPVVSVVVAGLLLQWSAIYFFNSVHKNGVGWRNGSAIHYFLHQDRIVTDLGIWARHHVPSFVTLLLTRATLLVEGALGFLLLVPLAYKKLRRVAFLLALGLHGGIALLARLGPFSYVMVTFFLMLFGEEELRWLGRWFGRPARAVTVVFDGDCGICLWICRLLKRLDPWQRLTFVANDDRAQLPPRVDPKLGETSVVVVDVLDRVYVEEAAVARAVSALPFGVFLVWWLYVPGLRHLGRFLYRRVARDRVAISVFFGLGACGVPGPAGTPRLVERSWGQLGIEAKAVLGILRETLALALMVVLATEVIKSNPSVSRHLRLQRPQWMSEVIGYTRMLEGWGMFAPEPPYEDGRLVVDGRTKDGRMLDPFTVETPELDPASPRGWGHDQLWCDYTNHIRLPHNQARRRFLKEYLLRQHLYSGRPEDELVTFDVWWIQDKSPKPGQQRGKPLRPERILSRGLVKDSLATPWLSRVAKQAGKP